jgi:hypothetical protein
LGSQQSGRGSQPRKKFKIFPKFMKKFLLQFLLEFLVLFLFCYNICIAAGAENFPNVSGTVLFQFQADHVFSTEESGVAPNNGFIYIEPNITANFNKNWSLKTDWRLQPNNVLTTRNSTYPERYRTFLQSDRGFGISDEGLLVEELKLHYENDNMKFFTGKFDPTFGTAYSKAKRIGIFTSQFAEDYNLREKIGAGITALLGNSSITFNTFFNDTTNLSTSVLSDRERASRNDGLAGNTESFSSYSVAFNGENLFGIEDWFYNIGYRSLGADRTVGRSREKGYVASTEYDYKIGLNSSLIPFFEITMIDNFTGAQGRDATYTVAALMWKCSSWIASISNLTRNIKEAQEIPKSHDHQLQLSIGYKFTDNLTIDVTRSNLKEGSNSAILYGMLMSYVYKF